MTIFELLPDIGGIIAYYEPRGYPLIPKWKFWLFFQFELSFSFQNGNFDCFFHFELSFSSQNGNFGYFFHFELTFSSQNGNFDLFFQFELSFFLKMEILTLFSNLNYFPNPKLEILTIFSILNSFFLPKLEILPIFSILNNKKIWETTNHFWFTSQISFLYIHVSEDKSILLFFELHTIIFHFFDNTYSYTI